MPKPIHFLLIPVLFAIQVHNHVGFIKFSAPVPTFLSDLSLKAQYDYKMILENDTIPLKKQSGEFKAWATTYNVTNQYKQFDTDQNATRTDLNKNVTQLVSQLSRANNDITKILENSSLSIQEQKEAIEGLTEQQKEISVLMFIRRLFDPQDVISKKLSSTD
uniref:DUF148 domain-containing protein n=1 Tax=Caenorhabditis japonica TaxID=281687 RepID=A0A8R1HVY0_CAEJA